ncbi:unnamed protein product [Umbelopsis vinacea]
MAKGAMPFYPDPSGGHRFTRSIAHALINANCPGWLAWIVSVIFVLLESAVIDLLAFAIITPIYIDILFDKTLKVRGLRRMFDTRVKVHNAVICCRGVTAGVFMLWFLLLAQVLVLLLTLPLHLIPVFGTLLACYINGWVACWGHHIHYDLEFRGWTVSESRRYAWQRKSEYANFGAIAVALELIPIFNLLFMWTNAVGAALWVADQYEENERKIASQTPSVEGLTTLDPYGRRAPTAEPSAATLYPDETLLIYRTKGVNHEKRLIFPMSESQMNSLRKRNVLALAVGATGHLMIASIFIVIQAMNGCLYCPVFMYISTYGYFLWIASYIWRAYYLRFQLKLNKTKLRLGNGETKEDREWYMHNKDQHSISNRRFLCIIFLGSLLISGPLVLTHRYYYGFKEPQDEDCATSQPELLEHMKNVAVQDFSAENVLFCEHYQILADKVTSELTEKKMTYTEIKEGKLKGLPDTSIPSGMLCDYIAFYNTFIKEGAPLQINIAHSDRKSMDKVFSEVASLHGHILEHAVSQIKPNASGPWSMANSTLASEQAKTTDESDNISEEQLLNQETEYLSGMIADIKITGNANVEKLVYDHFLTSDISETSIPVVPDNFAQFHEVLFPSSTNGIVFQINDIIDIANSAQSLLDTMTASIPVRQVYHQPPAVATGPIVNGTGAKENPKSVDEYMPGCKVKNCRVNRGTLMLEPGNCQLLGGEVSTLYNGDMRKNLKRRLRLRLGLPASEDNEGENEEQAEIDIITAPPTTTSDAIQPPNEGYDDIDSVLEDALLGDAMDISGFTMDDEVALKEEPFARQSATLLHAPDIRPSAIYSEESEELSNFSNWDSSMIEFGSDTHEAEGNIIENVVASTNSARRTKVKNSPVLSQEFGYLDLIDEDDDDFVMVKEEKVKKEGTVQTNVSTLKRIVDSLLAEQTEWQTIERVIVETMIVGLGSFKMGKREIQSVVAYIKSEPRKNQMSDQISIHFGDDVIEPLLRGSSFSNFIADTGSRQAAAQKTLAIWYAFEESPYQQKGTDGVGRKEYGTAYGKGRQHHHDA